jgi:hypothetical protein
VGVAEYYEKGENSSFVQGKAEVVVVAKAVRDEVGAKKKQKREERGKSKGKRRRKSSNHTSINTVIYKSVKDSSNTVKYTRLLAL